MQPTYKLFLLLLFLSAMIGCQPRDYTTAERYDCGLVVCLSGAGGMACEVERLRKGLYKGGVECALENFQWSRKNVFNDQMDIEENRRQAALLARRIETYQLDYPARPVYLLGVSAGTGLIVWAIEDLKPGHSIDGVFLIASSLDAGYDLTRSLERIDDQMYIFYCLTDPLLSVGSILIGTVDRRHSFAGGFGGFNTPKDADRYTEDIYHSKLTQRGWHLTDIFQGHMGGHLGASNPAFVRKHIAPLITANEPPPGDI